MFSFIYLGAFTILLLYLLCNFFIYIFDFGRFCPLTTYALGTVFYEINKIERMSKTFNQSWPDKMENLDLDQTVGNCAAGLLFRLIPCTGDI